MNQDAVTVEIPGLRLSMPRLRLAPWPAMGDLPWLAELPIRGRFILLVILALLAALVFGSVYHHASQRIEGMLLTQEGYRRLNDLAGDVRGGAVVAQNLMEVFVRDHDEAAVADLAQQLAEIRDRLERMAELSQEGPMAQAVGEAQVGLEAIVLSLGRLETGMRQMGLSGRQGLRARLGEAAQAVEAELAMWPASAPLSLAVARMRLAERDYMLDSRPDALGRHRAAAGQLDMALDTSSLPNSTREDLRRFTTTYGEALEAFAAGTGAMRQDLAEVRSGFKGLQPAMEQVLNHARQGMAEAIAAQEAERRATGRQVAVVGILAGLGFLAACLLIAHSILRPLRAMQGAMERLSHGDHAVAVPGTSRRDEMGDMARAVEVFKENAVAMVRLQEEQRTIRAEADAANRAHLLDLAAGFEQAVKATAGLVASHATGIESTALRMTSGAKGGQGGALSVAEAALQCRAGVEAVAEAGLELEQSVAEISRGTSEAATIARAAVDRLGAVNGRIGSLSDTAARIGRVVTLIGEVASRTNMLALNATIEAQRAGVAGQGFAVVANEVKVLAHQTANSSREIAAEVASIQAATAETASAMVSIGESIVTMDRISAQVADAALRQRGVATRIGECVRGMEEGTRRLGEGVTAVTQAAIRYCAAAIRVIWAAKALAHPARSLDREVDSFLITVRR